MNCQELTDQIEEYKPYNEQEEKDKRPDPGLDQKQ